MKNYHTFTEQQTKGVDRMSEFMKAVLGRVLREEIQNQLEWKKEEVEHYGFDGKFRDDNIAEIKQFMKDNGIKEV